MFGDRQQAGTLTVALAIRIHDQSPSCVFAMQHVEQVFEEQIFEEQIFEDVGGQILVGL